MDYSYPLLCSCERNAGRVALVGRRGSVTYDELEDRIAGLAAGLRELGATGSRVASVMANDPETVEVYMALARCGAVGVPLNTRLAPGEKRYMLEDADVSLIVASDEFAEEAARLAETVASVRGIVTVGEAQGALASVGALRETPPGPEPSASATGEEEPATIIYTSGTTGAPKGVVRSHRANSWNAVNSALGSPRTTHDVELFNLPLFGIGFLHFVVPALLGGATIVLDGAFDPVRAWELLERHRATRTFLAPTMLATMLAVEGQEARDIDALELVYTAYAFPARLRERALARFGPRFIYMYGLTEAQLTCSAPGDFEAKPTGVGRTMGVSRVRVVDADGASLPVGETGEIAFAGPSIMTGYHGLADATGETVVAGWVRTGDLGCFDADGDLHYVGRSKEMIKTGGFSVDPVEVENAILMLDEVREAAVVGVEDERWGEAVVAVISLESGAALEPADVIAACKGEIAGYKVPKHVLVIDELPKNPTGKVERGRLRDLFRARPPAEHGRHSTEGRP